MSVVTDVVAHLFGYQRSLIIIETTFVTTVPKLVGVGAYTCFADVEKELRSR